MARVGHDDVPVPLSAPLKGATAMTTLPAYPSRHATGACGINEAHSEEDHDVCRDCGHAAIRHDCCPHRCDECPHTDERFHPFNPRAEAMSERIDIVGEVLRVHPGAIVTSYQHDAGINYKVAVPGLPPVRVSLHWGDDEREVVQVILDRIEVVGKIVRR